MKKRLGVSVYPTIETMDQCVNYIKTAKKHGFTKIFLSLLQIDLKDKEQIKVLQDFIALADQEAFTISIDITKSQMQKWKISIFDLSYLKKLGIGIIRLDDAFSGLEEAIMSNNPHDIKIELNITTGQEYLETVLSNSPNKDNIIGTHNFYPHRYTGLDQEYFIKTSLAYKKHGLRTGAFINSKEATIGPWPIQEGICTLETHRSLPVDIQVKDLRATGIIDDIIIGNAFASEAELKKIAETFFTPSLPLSIRFSNSITDEEKQLVMTAPHIVRRGYSKWVVRSATTRMWGKNLDLPPRSKADMVRRGNVVIDNNLYLNYKGEVQICLADYPTDEKQTIIGTIPPEEMFLVDRIAKEPWRSFCFVQVD